MSLFPTIKAVGHLVGLFRTLFVLVVCGSAFVAILALMLEIPIALFEQVFLGAAFQTSFFVPILFFLFEDILFLLL